MPVNDREQPAFNGQEVRIIEKTGLEAGSAMQQLHGTWILLAIGLLSAGAVAACSSTLTRPDEAALGQPFDLPAGGSTFVPGGLSMTFDRVSDDSRCPIEALCVTPGDVTVHLTLARAHNTPVQSAVHLQPPLSEVSYLSYSVKLIAVVPPRSINRQIRPEEYVATLRVTMH